MSVVHTIFLVGLLAGGSALGAALLRSHGEVAEARHLDVENRDALVHTEMTITSETYAAGPKEVTYLIENEGSTTLDIRLLDFVLDGTWSSDKVIFYRVESEQTDWWAPATTLEIKLKPVDTDPTAAVVTSEHGAQAVWRS